MELMGIAAVLFVLLLIAAWLSDGGVSSLALEINSILKGPFTDREKVILVEEMMKRRRLTPRATGASLQEGRPKS